MSYYDDGYNWPQEHTTYDHALTYQDSVSFSGYESYGFDNYDPYNASEFREPKFEDYYHDYSYDYGYDYDYGDSGSNTEINYFANNYVESKLIVYEPVDCDTGYVKYHTHYSIANSEIDSGFNEPEFEEYDPTPYGGGYDIVSVYGKPLPPSDKTCYPRSDSKLSEPRPGPNPESQPQTKFMPEREPKVEPEHEPEPKLLEPGPVHIPALRPPTPGPLVEPEQLEPALAPIAKALEYSYSGYGYDYPWPEYDNGNAIGVGYDYGYGKQVVQIPPCEYDPEIVDLCENLFGNWPCLARIRNQQMDIDNNNQGITRPGFGHRNPWDACANYFFGGPIKAHNQ